MAIKVHNYSVTAFKHHISDMVENPAEFHCHRVEFDALPVAPVMTGYGYVLLRHGDAGSIPHALYMPAADAMPYVVKAFKADSAIVPESVSADDFRQALTGMKPISVPSLRKQAQNQLKKLDNGELQQILDTYKVDKEALQLALEL